MSVQDAALKATRAYPASTTAVTSSVIDLEELKANDKFPGSVECVLTANILTITQLPDTKTMTFLVAHSDNADLSSSETLIASAIVQTGATGGSAAAAEKRFRLPSNVKRYLGYTITPSASGTGDASAVSSSLALEFPNI
jgi:hypothetical protein